MKILLLLIGDGHVCGRVVVISEYGRWLGGFVEACPKRGRQMGLDFFLLFFEQFHV